jgi:transketolase
MTLKSDTLNAEEKKQLDLTSRKLRGRIIKMIQDANCAHLGSSLSCIDILTVLYWKVMNVTPETASSPDRDRFILSKGHAATSLYSTLAFKGFFDKKLLDTFHKDGTLLAEHPVAHSLPGIEAATGSLGHGLPIACGLALAAKLQNKNYKVYVVMSDGECNEGSNWEAALFASAKKLDNIIAFIDYNKWQATGRSDEVLGIAPLSEKWEKFGWETHEINGHDLEAIYEAATHAKNKSPNGKPTMIVCNTIKGKGVSFMEDDNNWHYRAPNEEEFQKALVELGITESDLQ